LKTQLLGSLEALSAKFLVTQFPVQSKWSSRQRILGKLAGRGQWGPFMICLLVLPSFLFFLPGMHMYIPKSEKVQQLFCKHEEGSHILRTWEESEGIWIPSGILGWPSSPGLPASDLSCVRSIAGLLIYVTTRSPGLLLLVCLSVFGQYWGLNSGPGAC
jgi:hypothetical protein